MDLESEPKVMQGSTVDYCDRWPAEGHSWVWTKHAGTPTVSTRSCHGCGYLDVSEVRARIEELTAELNRERGFRVAAENWAAEHAAGVEKLTQERDAIRSVADSLYGAEIHVLRKHVEELTKERAALRADDDELGETIDSLERQLGATQRKNAAMQKVVDEAAAFVNFGPPLPTMRKLIAAVDEYTNTQKEGD